MDEKLIEETLIWFITCFTNLSCLWCHIFGLDSSLISLQVIFMNLSFN